MSELSPRASSEAPKGGALLRAKRFIAGKLTGAAAFEPVVLSSVAKTGDSVTQPNLDNPEIRVLYGAAHNIVPGEAVTQDDVDVETRLLETLEPHEDKES